MIDNPNIKLGLKGKMSSFGKISLKKSLVIIYVCFLAFGVLYTYKTVNSNSVKLTDINKDKKVEPKVHYVNAKLIIFNNSQRTQYDIKGTEPFSLLDMLEDLHNRQDLFFEKIYYRKGLKIDNVNYIKAPEGMVWGFFVDGTALNSDVSTYQVLDNKVYELKLTRI